MLNQDQFVRVTSHMFCAQRSVGVTRVLLGEGSIITAFLHTSTKTYATTAVTPQLRQLFQTLSHYPDWCEVEQCESL